MYFSTNLTLDIRTKDLHGMVRSRKPVVVPIECPEPKIMGPTGLGLGQATYPTESPRTATDFARRRFAPKTFRLLDGSLLSPATSGTFIWASEVPQWRSTAKAPTRGLADEAEAVCRYCLHILTAETITIWKFRTIRLPILDQYGYVSRWESIRHFAPSTDRGFESWLSTTA